MSNELEIHRNDNKNDDDDDEDDEDEDEDEDEDHGMMMLQLDCTTNPPEHSFTEHSTSGKLYCRRCACVMCVGGSDHATYGDGDGDGTTRRRDTTCATHHHHFTEHVKTHAAWLYCTKCGTSRTAPVPDIDDSTDTDQVPASQPPRTTTSSSSSSSSPSSPSPYSTSANATTTNNNGSNPVANVTSAWKKGSETIKVQSTAAFKRGSETWKRGIGTLRDKLPNNKNNSDSRNRSYSASA